MPRVSARRARSACPRPTGGRHRQVTCKTDRARRAFFRRWPKNSNPCLPIPCRPLPGTRRFGVNSGLPRKRRSSAKSPSWRTKSMRMPSISCRVWESQEKPACLPPKCSPVPKVANIRRTFWPPVARDNRDAFPAVPCGTDPSEQRVGLAQASVKRPLAGGVGRFTFSTSRI